MLRMTLIAVLVVAAGCNRSASPKVGAAQQYAEGAQAPRDALYRLKADMDIRANPEQYAAHLSDAKVEVDRWKRGLAAADQNRQSAKLIDEALTYFEMYAESRDFEQQTAGWVERDIRSEAAIATGGVEKSKDAHAQAVGRMNAAWKNARSSLDALDKALSAGN